MSLSPRPRGCFVTGTEVGKTRISAALLHWCARQVWRSADLAHDLGLLVLLVVGLRQGCINHALLTAEAVRARGLRLIGWIGNAVDANMPWVDENITCLRERLWRQHRPPCLGLVPRLPATGAAFVAAHLDDAALHTVFAAP